MHSLNEINIRLRDSQDGSARICFFFYFFFMYICIYTFTHFNKKIQSPGKLISMYLVSQLKKLDQSMLFN